MPPGITRGEETLIIRLGRLGAVEVTVGYAYTGTKVPKPPPAVLARLRIGDDKEFNDEEMGVLQLDATFTLVEDKPAGKGAAPAAKAKAGKAKAGKAVGK